MGSSSFSETPHRVMGENKKHEADLKVLGRLRIIFSAIVTIG